MQRHIFDTGYDWSRLGDFQQQLNDVKARHIMPNSADNTTVEKFYQDLFDIRGYQDFINCNDQCYRQLYSYSAEYHQTFAKCAPTVERIRCGYTG